MKLEVTIQVPVCVTAKVKINATKSEIRELCDLDRDDDVEDYYVDYVNDHRFDEVMDDIDLDEIKPNELWSHSDAEIDFVEEVKS
tara:strand:+ start:180 stop:434 length:255 start_codon:yes stop_codon:yes gene_type:complete